MLTTIIGALLLTVTLFVWLGLIANLTRLHDSDLAGNGMAVAYGLFLTIALWLLVGSLLLFAGWKGEFPALARVFLFVLYPLSGAAAIGALYLMAEREIRWPLAIPFVAPLLLMLVALWSYLPSMRNAVPAALLHAVVWPGLLAASISPWKAVMERSERTAARRREMDASREQQRMEAQQQQRKETLARFEKLTGDSPLWQWQEFAGNHSELRTKAFERIRLLARRQADAEAMLQRGMQFPLVELPNLGLQPTPAFCEAAREHLTENARAIRPAALTPAPYPVIADRLEIYLPGMEWLVNNGCNLNGVLREMETTASAYPPSPDREVFLARLASLRRPE